MNLGTVTDESLLSVLGSVPVAKTTIFSILPAREGKGAIMTDLGGSSLRELCARVKHLGYAVSKRVRLYGEEFEVVSDPFPHNDGIAVHVKTRDSKVRILRLPATLLHAARKHLVAKAA